MTIRISTVIFSTFLLFLSQSALALEISEQEYLSIKKGSAFIEQECSPDDCLVVGIGRSPAPFMAYLQLKHQNYAYTVPLSKFKYDRKRNPLESVFLEKLYVHLDNHFPSNLEINQRKILVVDYTQQGWTLLSLKSYLQDYLFEKRNMDRNRISVLAIVDSVQKNIAWLPPELNPLIMIDRDSELMKKLNHQEFDNYAEFGQFDVKNDSSPVQRNPGYKDLIFEINRHNVSTLKNSSDLHGVSFIKNPDNTSSWMKQRIAKYAHTKPDEEFSKILLTSLCDDEPKVRTEAMKCLANNQVRFSKVSKCSEEEIDQIYLRALTDPDKMVSENAVDKLIQFYEGRSLPETVFEIYMTVLKKSSFTIQVGCEKLHEFGIGADRLITYFKDDLESDGSDKAILALNCLYGMLTKSSIENEKNLIRKALERIPDPYGHVRLLLSATY